MEDIILDEQLLFTLTSRYASKFGKLPDTHKQAIQFAYEQGKADFIDTLLENIVYVKYADKDFDSLDFRRLVNATKEGVPISEIVGHIKSMKSED